MRHAHHAVTPWLARQSFEDVLDVYVSATEILGLVRQCSATEEREILIEQLTVQVEQHRRELQRRADLAELVAELVHTGQG